jgi:DNA-binding CsgD family transcriptional regulator
MVGQEFGKWIGDDSPESEAAFHETLVRLRAEGASNREIAEAVMRSAFVLGLVWIVTAKRQLRIGKATMPPCWADRLARDPELRDEWRVETLYLLGKRLRARWDERCELQRPSIGGYWRVKIMYAAVKSAWNLHGEGRLKVRRGDASVLCYGDGMSMLPNKDRGECSNDIRLDLMTAIDELENVRQREVMRLSLDGHSYQEIADRLTEASGSSRAKVTYEMVRGAFERAREVLRTRLTEPAA